VNVLDSVPRTIAMAAAKLLFYHKST